MRTVDKREAMEEDLNCILIESHTFSFRQIPALKSEREWPFCWGASCVPALCDVQGQYTVPLDQKTSESVNCCCNNAIQQTTSGLSNHSFLLMYPRVCGSPGQLEVGRSRLGLAEWCCLKLWIQPVLALSEVWLISTPHVFIPGPRLRGMQIARRSSLSIREKSDTSETSQGLGLELVPTHFCQYTTGPRKSHGRARSQGVETTPHPR